MDKFDPDIIDVYAEGGEILPTDSNPNQNANGDPADSPQRDGTYRNLSFYAFGVYGPDGAKIQCGPLEQGQPNPFRPIFPPSLPPHPPFTPHFPPQFPWNHDFVVQAEAWDRAEAQRAKQRYWRTPLILFAVTCCTTWYAGQSNFGPEGYLFALAVMLILTCHEMGHFLQALRYKVPASLPYFIPMPLGPIGTMGAIIRMDGRIPNTRTLFDIGISGPLGGLVPTIVFCWLGIKWSYIGPIISHPEGLFFGHPLLFDWLTNRIYGPLSEDLCLYWHPFAFAGWVGLLITSLNLLPIGQLDGGHIFYAIFKKKAGFYSAALFYVLIFLVIYNGLWAWSLMLFLLALLGTQHPPTQNDAMKLGFFRTALGIATLAFILIGFTPNPIKTDFEEGPARPTKFYALARSTG